MFLSLCFCLSIEYIYVYSNSRYNIDVNIIIGHSFNGFRISDYWRGVPYGYLFFMLKREFIGCYKNSAVMLGADQVERVITAQPEKVVMKLMF